MVDRSSQKLTKRQQRLSEKSVSKLSSYNMILNKISPMTINQETVFKDYNEDKNIFLHGFPGTGKTFISMYLALKELNEKYSTKKKIIIIRSAQSTKNVGFLPGDMKRKMEIYEAPYKAICSELFDRGDAYEILKQKDIIEFESTSFLRGLTIDNSIIILDEVQNLTQIEWFTVLSRVGENSRILICGDTKQDDLTSERFKEVSGISTLIKVFDNMQDTSLVHFNENDIVRSGFVKSLIITMNNLGI